ncbi:MAG: DUF371 domain-containing protein [Thaumarchaeota archaeon]|nr:DUF371 domain-containing protein [Nitrososphaerota archaeon]
MESENLAVSEGEVLKETVRFRGHRMVRSTHPTTIEVTTEEYLTENGDCIIGVGASKGCAQLDQRVKERLRLASARVKMRIIVGGHTFEMNARGDPRLKLSHPHDIVIRKSDFVSDRTLAIKADASSRDLPREMVGLLKNPETAGRLEIEVA